YREYDLAHLKLVFEFSIYTVWSRSRYGISNGLDTAYWGFLGARIRRIFLDGYGVLVFKMMLFDVINALPPKMFEGYDRDIRELYTGSREVRDEIFSQRYRLRSLEQEQERATMTFGTIWRPVLALESWA
ncbi:hypothetical protein Tco_1131333, partial [Tanacetum coccineum]